MGPRRLLAPLLACALFATASLAVAQHLYPPPEPAARDLQAAGQQGYRAGLTTGRVDLEHKRKPAYASHPEYQHPTVPQDMVIDYRMGFERGYEEAMQQQHARS